MRILSAIYLPKLFHQVEPSGLAFLLPLDQSSGSTQWVTPPSFTELHLMGHATEFRRNPDAVHRQSPGYKIRQSNRTELPPHQVLRQLPPMVNALERHRCYQLLSQWSRTDTKEPCFAASSVPCILASSRRFLGHSAYVSKRSHILPTQAPSQAGSALQAFVNCRAPWGDPNEEGQVPTNEMLVNRNSKLQQDDGLVYRISEPSGTRRQVSAIDGLSGMSLDMMTNAIT